MKSEKPPCCHYYVDESGDGVLFDGKGRVLVGRDNHAAHFILGLVELNDPERIAQALDNLRTELLADPYFRNVPSMQTDTGKTAVFFHAKDDLPEVRREVFRLLAKQEFRFYAVIKSLSAVLDYVRGRNALDPAYCYRPNELYDLTVRMLFKQRLHQHGNYRVAFARRAKSDRTRELGEQLKLTRQRFLAQYPQAAADSEIQVVSAFPKDEAGLQVVDYCLWALQRLYEKGEDRFIQLLWPAVGLIHDVDDKRKAGYGMYYNKKNPPLSEEEMGKRQV